MFERIIIIGNLGKDPVIKTARNGNEMAYLSVATNRKYVDDATGETRKATTWYSVSVGGPQVGFIKDYCKAGSQVLIDGKMRPDRNTGGPRIWIRTDGTPAASYEILADVVRLLGKKDSEYSEAAAAGYTEILF